MFKTFLYLSLLALIASKITVHVIPHSHDDAGWNWTYDEYFYKTHSAPRGVKNIISSALASLKEDPKRTFSQTEVVYFKKWWDEVAIEEEKELAREMIKNGQLIFLNGGYVMSDEATPHYSDFINQVRMGLRFLKETFDYVPRTAWQLDPFGHSATYAQVMTEFGFENLVFCRIDEKEKEHRKSQKSMEFIWKPVEGASLLTHVSPSLYYPAGDVGDLQNDVLLNQNEEELKKVAESLRREAFNEVGWSRHEHYFLFFGGDFIHDHAQFNYRNIEALMDYIHANYDDMELKFSNPDRYFDAIRDTDFPIAEGHDFFPYGDADYSYWTGYFTSRPYLKGLVRDAGITIDQLELTNVYLALDYPELFKKHKGQLAQVLESLKEVNAINQHHDAIAGTAKERVSQDYEVMLTNAISKAKLFMEKVAGSIQKRSVEFCSFGVSIDNCEFVLQFLEKELFVFMSGSKKGLVMLRAYSDDVAVFDMKNNEIDSDLLEIEGNKHIIFKTDADQVVFRRGNKRSLSLQNVGEKEISGENFNLKFNGKGNSFTLHKNDEEYKIDLFHSYYVGYDGQNTEIKPKDQCPNGAYILTTTTVDSIDFEFKGDYMFEGKVATVVVNKFAHSHLAVVFDNEKGDLQLINVLDSVESDDEGKEYVLKVKTDINNTETIDGEERNVFYTDSNGLNLMKRVTEWRESWSYKTTEPVGANFYPVVHSLVVKDDKKRVDLLTERAVSGGLINKGEIMFVINRYTTTDDRKGVDEPIHEQGSWGRTFTVRNYLTIGETGGNMLNDYIDSKRTMVSSEKELKFLKNNKKLFSYDEDCIVASFYRISDEAVIVQFLNVVDPKLGEKVTCEAKLEDNERVKFTKVNLAGTKEESQSFLAEKSVSLSNYQLATFKMNILN